MRRIRCRGAALARAFFAEITWPVYSYLMANDEQVGRDVMRATMDAVLSDVYWMCPNDAANVR
ncbi:MAG: hypothetical protein M3O28_04530 [Actinomycetota bacterium]|nr:hypothetical protein [Actinomycetota bacterium]